MDNEIYIPDGYVVWARKVIDSKIFCEKPAIWFKIWFYLISRVNHRKTGQYTRGSALISYNQIIQATNASKGQVDKCFRWLRSVDMVSTHRSTRGMVVTIRNYNIYQDPKNYSVETKSTAGRNKVDTINKKLRSNKDLMSFQNKNNGIPHKEIIDLYHTILPELPRVKVFTKKRNSMLNARWFEDTKRQSLDWWDGYFKHVRESKFLMGDNKGVWQANFEWLITSSKLTNVIEGVYHH